MVCDILFITDSRSEYFLMREVLRKLNKKVNLKIIATGAHLSKQYGETALDIEKEGFNVERLDTLIDSNSISAMIKTLGIELFSLSQAVEKIKPKLLLVEGDRYNALAAAIIGSHFHIPVVHHGGGDISGSIDNKIRYAISMFSDYHLVGNKKSYETLLQRGFDKSKVFLVGEPGLADIYLKNFTPKKELITKFELEPNKPIVLFLFNPDLNNIHNLDTKIKSILNILLNFDFQIIAIYSNSDAGGKIINSVLNKYSAKYKNVKVFPNLSREDFLGFMNICTFMIGNSSSGIVELPSFKKPFILLGERQKGRLTAGNVLYTKFETESVNSAISKVLKSSKLKEKLKKIKNPYGNKKTYMKMVQVILSILKNV